MPDEELNNNFDDVEELEESETPEDSNSLDSEEEPEEEGYGEKVQKRISKEVQKRKALEDKVYNYESRFAEQEQRLADQEQRWNEREFKQDSDDVDSRLKTLSEKRKEMYELGDIDPDVEDQYQDLRNEQRQNKQRQPAPKQPVQQVPQAQQAWLAQNAWYNSDADRQNKANEVFQGMLDEGFDPNHPGMYANFDKRLNPERETAPPPASAGLGKQSKKSKPKLTNSDLETMGRYGLDSNNPAHRKEWLSNKGAA